ncbi:MAG TPA: ribonuclease Y [Myxococcota bacterium]|nr:ribonuclease Y [Myxococcota bacterium]HOH77509.1 ribonuclease Y [Myxococcota bacterium]
MVGILLAAIGGIVGGGAIAFLATRATVKSRLEKEKENLDAAIQESSVKWEAKVQQALSQARNADIRVKALEKELNKVKSDADRKEERLAKREETVDRKMDTLVQRESEIVSREKETVQRESDVKARMAEAEKMTAEARTVLESVAGLSQEEARAMLTERLMEDVKLSAAKSIKIIEEEAKEEAEKRAKKIVGVAMMRYAAEFANERTVSVVQLPSEEMKGRIIGREGRNIRAFEQATGIDVIIDDSPDTVIVSGFNPVRREIARLALEKLVQDGRIHPARIEELVEKTAREVDQNIKETGEDALYQLSLGTMHPELVKLIGRMKYRTSYGQNVLQHSLEVGGLSGLMAAEMGVPVKMARRAGLLHDIGKAIDHEVEGPHALVGANFARKFGENAEIVHAIASHHNEEKPLTLLAHITAAADAVSGSRPGARRESLENYLKRLGDLEEISNSFAGVNRSYAIQAGREVRVIVENERIDDDGATILARDIARKIEEQLSYPGQVKVCVIRETRAVDFAK